MGATAARLAELVGGPLHGEIVEIVATTRVIEIELRDGGFASYLAGRNGTWQYAGTGPWPPVTTAPRRCDGG